MPNSFERISARELLAMSERFFLTGDKKWFLKNRARLQAAADWIIRQRTQYLKDIPNRKDLLVAGLMPPQMLGDNVIMSGAPVRDEDVSITVSRIRGKDGGATVLFMDLFCKDSPIGKELCAGARVAAVRQAFAAEVGE